MSRVDQYRAAKLLITQHGEYARTHAMRQVLNLRALEDFFGEWAWMGVFDAVLDLEANELGSGQAVQ